MAGVKVVEDKHEPTSRYNKDQLTPVRVEGSELLGLVTDHNDLGSGRFSDSRYSHPVLCL